VRQPDGLPTLRGLCAAAGPADTSPPAPALAGHALSFYWAHPETGTRLAAYGEALRAEARSPRELRHLFAALTRPDSVEWLDGPADARDRPPGPFFGAVAFDPDEPLGPEWAGFAPARWAAPRVVVFSAEGRRSVAAFGDEASRDLDLALRALSTPPAPAPLPRVEAAALNGARTAWGELVSSALDRIDRNELSKVVLARTVDVRGEGPFPEQQLLAALEARHPICHTFFLRGDGDSSFAGATPEMLCRLDGRDLSTDALAGSARLAEAYALLERSKELREHAWVVEHVVAALRSISERVEAADGPQVRKLADVAHLYTPIHARLREGKGLADVVETLHPTPAVGGVPSRAAMRFISEEEKLGRGLYAGIVGLCGPGRADLAVALRCALLRGPSARLYVGAGIVAGSTAEGEWAETELKARALLSALGVSG
jgi:salicylate biosynthesis isochorismate synthase/menaquinone-specific isochorismate synthase